MRKYYVIVGKKVKIVNGERKQKKGKKIRTVKENKRPDLQHIPLEFRRNTDEQRG